MSQAILTANLPAPSPSSRTSAAAPADVSQSAGVVRGSTGAVGGQAPLKSANTEKAALSRSRGTWGGSSAAVSTASSASTVASRRLSRGSFSAPHSSVYSTEPLSDGSTCSMLGTLQREILLLAYTHGALEFGSFTTKGGRKSPFTFKPECLTNGEVFELLARAYAVKIVQSGVTFDVLFGTARTGTPLVACTSMVLAREYAMPAPFVYDRKEPGEHGGGGQLLGAVEAFRRKPVGCVSDGGGSSSSTGTSTGGSTSSSNTGSSSTSGSSTSGSSTSGSSDSGSTISGSNTSGSITSGSTASSSTSISSGTTGAFAGRSNSASSISTRPARVVVLEDTVPALKSLREAIGVVNTRFPDAEVAAVCILLDMQDRDARDERLSEAQMFEAEHSTKVLSLLTTTDILHFLNELIASGENLEARSYLQKARNSLLDYQRTYSATDELLSDVL